MATNRTIVLEGDLSHHEEAVALSTIYPGMLVEKLSTGKVQPASVRGGRTLKWFAKEDYLQGKTKTQAYSADDVVLIHKAEPGERINALLKNGETVAIGDWAISYGDGTVCKAASSYLANIAAASSAVTNTITETTFSNGSVTIPANTLKVGDVIRVRAQGIATSTNSTDTLTVRSLIGTDVLATTGAVDVANNDIFTIDVTMVVRTIGATGTFVAFGDVSIGAGGTVTRKSVYLGSTTIDTTAAATLTVKATWSVASASNSCRLDVLTVEHVKASTSAGAGPAGGDVVGQFDEAVTASGNDFASLIVI